MNILSIISDGHAAPLLAALGPRSIVLVGIMGAGKTTMGRRLAAHLGLPFVDADTEIELAAGMSIPDIFAKHGEAHFRDGERRVLARILSEGPKVVATGGGAFMQPATRERIAASGVSVWLKPEFDVVMRRVRKRNNRPLLNTPDPEGAMRRLMLERDPVYALADLTIESREAPHESVLQEILGALHGFLGLPAEYRPSPVAAPPQDIRVALAGRAYDIVIGEGLLAEAGPRLASLVPGAACAVIVDANVARLYLPALQASLEAANIRYVAHVIPAGETSKSYAQFSAGCDAVIAARLERDDLVVALGGGVTGDLAGFIAASVRRGMRLVQIPTSLLAQVDSSVGGKTGINSRHGKNLVGAFHQPALVLADTGVLDSLPAREFRAGYAEVVKYGLIDNLDFFEWLEANRAAVFAGGPQRAEAIRRSCAAKAAVVSRDETETGDRALLNLGHTFAHALERLTQYDGARLVHGEAVAIGMACAFRFSTMLGLCAGQEASRVERHLHAAGLPTRFSHIPSFAPVADAILDAMYQDKKVRRGKLTFILASGIGASFIARDVDSERAREFLAREIAGP